MGISRVNLEYTLKEVYVKHEKKFEKMTNREKEIFRLWINGHKSETISNMLGISKNTVSTHRKNITKKTKLKSPKEFVLFALAFDLI